MAALTSLAAKGDVDARRALGRGRSAVVAAAWLLKSRQVASVSNAVAAVKKACPLARISATSKQALGKWWHGQ